MKFAMETDHNYSYKHCMKYCLLVNSYKNGDGVKHCGYVRQI